MASGTRAAVVADSKLHSALFEEICPACGGFGIVDNGYIDERMVRDGGCLWCAGSGRVFVERQLETRRA